MKPVIAIVGRPNVGKSTFFNRLTASRDALVTDRPGVTRDRKYGVVHYTGKSFLVIDTGGIGEEEHDSKEVADLITVQSMRAANESSVLIWIVDGRIGLTHIDELLAAEFRKLGKPVYLGVNKLEGQDQTIGTSDFYSLGLDQIYAISAMRGDGIKALMDNVAALFPQDTRHGEEGDRALTLAVLGRPNVGKSTLVNCMVGEERVLTFNHPGTTRDSIRIPFARDGNRYALIDTAGVRRKSRINDVVEKFSVIKSFDAIGAARIMILVIDAGEGVTEQDVSLLGMIENSGKPVIIVVNKWDGLEAAAKKLVRDQLSMKFRFVDYAEYHFISSLHGTGVGNIFKTIGKIGHTLDINVSTADMTAILEAAIAANPPAMVRGRRIKLRYAHLGGQNPIRVIIHGNQTENMPHNYIRYLAKFFRQQLKLTGTPVLIKFKHGDNPFKGKKNKLTRRQTNKRKRLIKFVKNVSR